jgi:TrmH family RNA methyltransferase
MTIASPKNPHLRDLRRLHRRRGREQTGLFLAEGEDLVEAAHSAGWPLRRGFRVAGAGSGGDEFLEVSAQALAGVSSLGSGTRMIGVYEQRWLREPLGPLCVYLHGVGDPGNVGTVLRSALAFGASCVALGAGCADPYSPKAVRASMGAIFGVALTRVEDPVRLPGQRVALVAGHGEPLQDIGDDPTTLLVGAEREGLPEQVIEQCQRVCHIPIRCESLNAAMAATVALYELSRQPRRGA